MSMMDMEKQPLTEISVSPASDTDRDPELSSDSSRFLDDSRILDLAIFLLSTAAYSKARSNDIYAFQVSEVVLFYLYFGVIPASWLILRFVHSVICNVYNLKKTQKASSRVTQYGRWIFEGTLCGISMAMFYGFSSILGWKNCGGSTLILVSVLGLMWGFEES